MAKDKISAVNHAASEKIDAESFPVDSILKREYVDKSQIFSEHANGKLFSPHYAKSFYANSDSTHNKLTSGRNQNLNNLVNPQSQVADILLHSPRPYLVENINHPSEQMVHTSEIFSREGRTSPLRLPSSFQQRKSPGFDKQNNNASIQHQDDNCNEKLEPLPLDDALQHSFQSSNLAYSQNSDARPNLSMKNNSVPYQKPYAAAFDSDLVPNFNGLNVSSNEVPFVPVQESEIISPRKRHEEELKEIERLPIKQITGVESSEKLTDAFPSPPETCQQCYETLNTNDVVVQTHQGGETALWHARCFICETCKELLVDLMYFFNKGKVYCGRHYSEIMKIPRCFACDEVKREVFF